MQKRALLAVGLAGLLGLFVLLGVLIARPGTQAGLAGAGDRNASVTQNQESDAAMEEEEELAYEEEEYEMLAPGTGKALDPNWKPQPVAGEPVSLAWPNIKVNNDSTQEAQNEPFIAINPANPKHIVVGANSWQPGNGYFEVYAYVSFDGGKTWNSSQPYINRDASRINAADPTIAFGNDGSVYFAFVALGPARGAVAVSRSTDGGLTWSSQTWATSFNSAADKPAIAAANGNLYLYYQNTSLYGRISGDGGATWSEATFIEAGGRNANPVVDNKGNVYVFYNTANSIKVAILSGAISTARPQYRVVTVANTVALQPRPTQYRATIYATGAADGNGNLYVAWADGRNAGRGNDILYSRSTDGGTTWSSPVTVNNDATGADQLMPALAVDKQGLLTIAWLDNRNDPANVNYDVYMAVSSDGVNFGDNVRVTSVSSNPNNDPRLQGTMIGDYFSIAVSNGMAYPVWTDTRNNNEDIYLAPVPLMSATNK
jgi:hypothetical protein